MLDPAHIDLVRHIAVALGVCFVIWFVAMFIYFALPARRAIRRR